MDVHAPHAPMHSWKDFWIHLGTITIGLLIAISLEQGVEWVHRIHVRHALESDLREEAQRNMRITADDLRITDNAVWMQKAVAVIDIEATRSNGNKIMLTLETAPCYAGTLNSPHVKYFAPSEAVWTAARESGMTALIPAVEARVYARLAHNLDLASKARDRVAASCDEIAAAQQRFSVVGPDSALTRVWTMTSAQAEKFAEAASRARIDISALVFRLRVVQVCEKAIVDQALNSDKIMEMIARVEDDNLDNSTNGAAKP